MLLIIGLYITAISLLFLGISLLIKFKDNGIVNTNSWHVILYKRIWCFGNNYELPNNICNYFWSYLLGFILLPLNILPIILNALFKKIRLANYNNDHKDVIVFGFMSWLFLIVFPLLSGFTIMDGKPLNFKYYLVGLLVFISFIAMGLIISFLIRIIIRIPNLFKKRKNNNLLSERLKDWKDKSCTRIIWKD